MSYKKTIRRTIPLVITMILGVIMIFDFYFTNVPIISDIVLDLTKYSTIIWGFAMPYAVLSVFGEHIKVIQKRTPGRWYYSIYMLAIILVFLFIGITQGTSAPIYVEFYQNLGAPVLSSMTGILTFYVLTATFRAWHARTTEALIMIISGILTTLGLIAPIGEIIWPGFVPIANFINSYISNAESVVFYVGTGLGGLLLGYRTLIGQETGYLRLEAE
jgi:hypothetical protein